MGHTGCWLYFADDEAGDGDDDEDDDDHDVH